MGGSIVNPLEWKFRGGGGLKQRNLPLLGVWIFSGTVLTIIIAELRAPEARTRGAPLIRDFGKPMYAKNFGYDVTVRPAYIRLSVRPSAPLCKPL